MMHLVTTPVVSGIVEWLQYAAEALAMDSDGQVMPIDGLEEDDGLYRPFYLIGSGGSPLEPANNASSYLSVAHAGVSHNELYGRPSKFHTVNFIIQARTQGISISDRDFIKTVISWGLAEPDRMNFGTYNHVGMYKILPESPVYFEKSSQAYISRVSMRFLLC